MQGNPIHFAACVTGTQTRQNQHGDDKRRQF